MRLTIPEKLKPLMTKKKRYKILCGGRGSGKSQTVGDIGCFEVAQYGHKIGCMREFQSSIKDSSHSLLKDEKISELLVRVKNALRQSYRQMFKTGIVDICRKCELEEGGSCCGAGLENKYDGWLLVINLLLGADLPNRRLVSGNCYFLGEKGCLLTVRHVICVNYVCKKITDQIEPEVMMRLRENEGEQLNSVLLLHEVIKKTVMSKLRA